MHKLTNRAHAHTRTLTKRGRGGKREEKFKPGVVIYYFPSVAKFQFLKYLSSEFFLQIFFLNAKLFLHFNIERISKILVELHIATKGLSLVSVRSPTPSLARGYEQPIESTKRIDWTEFERGVFLNRGETFALKSYVN